MGLMKDGIRAVMSESVERKTLKDLKIVAEQCDICNAPQMVTPDGEHHCDEQRPSSPSYTLAELNGLAREFITEQEHQGHYPTNLQLVLSLFLAWIAKAKREQGEVRGI